MIYLFDKDLQTRGSIEQTTFKDLNKLESDLEELLRLNADLIGDGEEEALMIVGQQVKTAAGGRSDLIAIDNTGNLVLIELKRDKEDIVHRKEPFEFQAIRYAASLAAIKSKEKFIECIFSPYVEKHRSDFSSYTDTLTSTEIAKRVLDDFYQQNNIPASSFNQKQKIILVASDFDEQTMSAVSWLCSNGLNIACYRALPYELNGQIIIEMERLLPLDEYEDYFVSVHESDASLKRESSGTVSSRTTLPRIDKLLAWGAVKAGDILHAKGRDNEKVTLLQDGRVKTQDGSIMSMVSWLKGVYGWSAVQTFVYALTESGESLSDIRARYMKQESEAAEKAADEFYEEMTPVS